jgi:riboflavin biosynthesis pyrimidine reductase
MKAERELVIGGPELAGHAMRAGLVDEVHPFLSPVIVGAANRLLMPARGRASSWWASAVSAASSTCTIGS